MRFPVHIDSWWRPLLLAGGATPRNSYVELTDDQVLFRFGLLFRRSVPMADVEGAVIRAWPLWYGVGWRTNLLGLVGLIGSYKGVVEVRLRKPLRVWGLLRCRRIAASLEDPNAFLAALARAQEPPAGTTPPRAGARHQRTTRRSRGRPQE
ncbi:MAG: hypothetical protein Q7T33_13045 [Dehalococcoidia bacterium]|nr:hypothetical protein [Dehalococcoidia bacterium]